MSGTGDERGAITLAEKILAVLDEGGFTATYKFAVLLGLMDCCLEQAGPDGSVPPRVPTRALARRVLELYWPHTAEFAGHRATAVLRQNSGGQAFILTAVRRFREMHGLADTSDPVRAERITGSSSFATLLDEVEWKLAEMPLPRLQQLGRGYEPFLYELDWGATRGGATIRRRQFRDGGVRREVRLRPGVGEQLVRLNGLLRPLVERQWAARVASFNPDLVGEHELDAFLFGRARTPTRRLVSELRELQGDRCFYCARTLPHRVEVDHFIPWSRYPDDGVHNLVVADTSCNGDKRHHLAATDHVARWRFRMEEHAAPLDEIARSRHWPSHRERTEGVACALYLRLPDEARLWLGIGTFAPPRRRDLRRILAASAVAEQQAADVPGPFEA